MYAIDGPNKLRLLSAALLDCRNHIVCIHNIDLLILTFVTEPKHAFMSCRKVMHDHQDYNHTMSPMSAPMHAWSHVYVANGLY